jgi:hypothetical protein
MKDVTEWIAEYMKEKESEMLNLIACSEVFDSRKLQNCMHSYLLSNKLHRRTKTVQESRWKRRRQKIKRHEKEIST